MLTQAQMDALNGLGVLGHEVALFFMEISNLAAANNGAVKEKG